MEKVNCDLCGSDNYEVLEDRVRFNFSVNNVICKKCGLIFINPRMNKEEYLRFNLEEYRKVYKKPEEPQEGFIKYQVFRGKEIYDFLSDYLKPNIRILDIGYWMFGWRGTWIFLAKDGF